MLCDKCTHKELCIYKEDFNILERKINDIEHHCCHRIEVKCKHMVLIQPIARGDF